MSEVERLQARVYELEQRLLTIGAIVKGSWSDVGEETGDEGRDAGQSDG